MPITPPVPHRPAQPTPPPGAHAVKSFSWTQTGICLLPVILPGVIQLLQALSDWAAQQCQQEQPPQPQ